MTNIALPTDRLKNLDFAAHNAEVDRVWAARNAHHPIRVPVIVGTNTRYFVFNAGANPERIAFRPYIEDPDVMFDQALRFQRWTRFNILQDAALGAPAAWTIAPDFQNFYEAAWFGCEVHYFDDQVPDTLPDFAADPERVMVHSLPDPFGGLMSKALEYYEYFVARAAREDFLGIPIKVNPPWCGLGTDGPFTVACNLFGPDFVCETLLAEPERLRKLLEFITEATIGRMAAWRRRFGTPVPQEWFSFADDSIALISTPQYVEHVLPFHRALCAALATPGPRTIHLCGDATRHFPTLQKLLNIQSFDTGFPVDFAALRKALGPAAAINGGPHVDLLLRGTVDQVYQECRRILQSGICEGGFFTLREGNNLAPYTPLENIEAMYRAAKAFGQY
jgi:uroporphyrinogen-III decarboxylase